jgi:quercetin dioxygenase-like cupin family protein
MRRRLMFALLAALLIAMAAFGFVQATPASGVTPTPIASGSLDPVNFNVKTGDWMAHVRIKGQTDVSVVENRIAPGGSFGWHSHPGPSLIIVKAGTITFYRADDPTCTPDVRTVGDALIDEGSSAHIGRNEGTEEVVVIVTRWLPAGAPTRNDEPAPAACGF